MVVNNDGCWKWEVGPRQLEGWGVDIIVLRRTQEVGHICISLPEKVKCAVS